MIFQQGFGMLVEVATTKQKECWDAANSENGDGERSSVDWKTDEAGTRNAEILICYCNQKTVMNLCVMGATSRQVTRFYNNRHEMFKLRAEAENYPRKELNRNIMYVEHRERLRPRIRHVVT